MIPSTYCTLHLHFYKWINVTFAFSVCVFLQIFIMYLHLLSMLQGKEIIEYYLRELEEEGVTYIPRWTPAVVSGTAGARPQLPPPSSARAIPVSSAKDEDPACATELVAGSPDGLWLLTSHN